MIRYVYNSQIQPPAPFVLITLQHPLTGAELHDVPAQIDSAADRTLIPLRHVQDLALPTIGDMLIGGLGGNVEVVSVYGVLLGIHSLPPRLLEVAAHPNEAWVLLGRDVINEHRALLDGPQLAVEID